MIKHKFFGWFANTPLGKRHIILTCTGFSPHEMYFGLKEAELRVEEAQKKVKEWLDIIGKIPESR